MSNPFPFPSPITTGTYQSSISTDRSWSVDLPSLRTPTYQLLPPPLNDCTVGLALRLSTLVWPTLKYLPIKSKCIKSNVKLILCQNRVCSLVNTKGFFFQEEAMEQKNHMKTKKTKQNNNNNNICLFVDEYCHHNHSTIGWEEPIRVVELWVETADKTS